MLLKDSAHCLNLWWVLSLLLQSVASTGILKLWVKTSDLLISPQTCSSFSAPTSYYSLPSVWPSGEAVAYQKLKGNALYGASCFIIACVFLFQRDGCSFRTSLPSPAEGTWRARLIWSWTPPTTPVFTSHPCILTITTCTTTPSTKWQWLVSLPQVRQGVQL